MNLTAEQCINFCEALEELIFSGVTSVTIEHKDVGYGGQGPGVYVYGNNYPITGPIKL
jgi:hypothetical protein